ncbi:MAG: ribosome silencing factor [Rickettsiaceae bacterium]
MNKETIKDFILKHLVERKASNINCLPLDGKVSIADYMIFASGSSVKNIRSIAEYVSLELKHTMNWNANVEGLKGSEWILLDAGNVILHLFHPEEREKLKLEEFWQN